MHGRTRAAGEGSPRAPKTSEGEAAFAAAAKEREVWAGLETSNRNNYQGRVRAAPLLSISARHSRPPGKQCNGCCACLVLVPARAPAACGGINKCRCPSLFTRVPLSVTLLHALHPFACGLPVRRRLVNRARACVRSQRRVSAYYCLGLLLIPPWPCRRFAPKTKLLFQKLVWNAIWIV